jgi:hypothetical protein
MRSIEGLLQEAELDRLYSRFPGGSVGWALLLLRLIDGIALAVEAVVVFGLGQQTGVSEPMGGLLLGLGLVATAIVLMLGLRTSLAGAAGAICTVGSVLYAHHNLGGIASLGDAWLVLCAVVFFVSSSLALLGPGGYSLDARLSGWKVIKLSSRQSNSREAE